MALCRDPGGRPAQPEGAVIERCAVQWLRSRAFVGLIYFMMLPVGAESTCPPPCRSRDGAVPPAMAWCRVVKALMPPMVGLRFSVRGTPPTGAGH